MLVKSPDILDFNVLHELKRLPVTGAEHDDIRGHAGAVLENDLRPLEFDNRGWLNGNLAVDDALHEYIALGQKLVTDSPAEPPPI